MAAKNLKSNGSYLEDYLESVTHLPAEIKRNFGLMRELDEVMFMRKIRGSD